MIRLVLLAGLAAVPGTAQAALRSTPDLGTAHARCRAGESGPALRVDIEGLKDRAGVLKLEVYPANDNDFLEDDNRLIAADKTFRRVVMPVPASGAVQLCVRVPAPGRYAVSILHDRNTNRKFDLSKDGIGFTGNPRLGFSKPKAADVAIDIGPGVGETDVVMNYRRGLLSFGPLKRH
ncbi:MAG: DUF2141 domain-containing protein [Sphingobium sp.]